MEDDNWAWRRDYNGVRPNSAIGNKSLIARMNGSPPSPPGVSFNPGFFQPGLTQIREIPQQPRSGWVGCPHGQHFIAVLRVTNSAATLIHGAIRDTVATGAFVRLAPLLEWNTARIEIVWHMRNESDTGLCELLDELRRTRAVAPEGAG